MFTALSRIVAPRVFAGLPMLLIGLWMLGPGGQTANGQIDCADVNFAGGVVTITGTAGDDSIVLTVEEVEEGGFTQGDPAAVPPVPGDPPVAALYLQINGLHCPDPATPANPAGIPLNSVTKIVINSLGGTDFIDLTGLDDDFGVVPPEIKSRPTEVDAGDGNDSVLGGDGADTIHGGNGNDLLQGNGGSDAMFGDAGDDTMFGGNGGDTMDGGAGFDTIDASAAGEAEDVAAGDIGIGADLDLNILEDVPVMVGDFVIRTTDDLADDTFERVIGTTLKDSIIGDPLLPTIMYGGEGNDFIRGGADVDEMFGGDDILPLPAGAGYHIGGLGEPAIDNIRGGGGAVILIGGA